MPKRLVVNADDFGFTRDVNEGIVLAYREGILRSTTLMATGPAFDDAVRLAEQNPGLNIGCHLVLVGGESVAEPGRRLPDSVAGFLRGMPPLERIQSELSAQIEKILAAGIQPTHLDTHKHVHLAPRVLQAVLWAARQYKISWVRQPFDIAATAAHGRASRSRRLLTRVIGLRRPGFLKAVHSAGLRTPDGFAGFQMTGHHGPSELAALIGELPGGVTEFMSHPGVLGSELAHAPTRLKQSRETELKALMSDEVRRAVTASGVELTSFREL